ncbi:hypothetical protein N8I77_010789 [Diaporthe amygdali]|uniref:Uncharacterized protein n=1 Tax=Phomopsis amygdali TaxID=1214568 RepID=A0AAD9SAN0_PHOAM|nr:hypothetical protein N8I77_010789 [Diaporthe amygdali]
MAVIGLTAGSHTHHCPVCHKSAKSSCVKNKHLKNCSKCGENYPPSLNPNGCPYCAQKAAAEEARKQKEKKKDDDKKKKDKKDNGEGSSKGKGKKK